MTSGFNAGVRAVACEIAKRRALLNTQFEALDIGREDTVYGICAEISDGLLRPDPEPAPEPAARVKPLEWRCIGWSSGDGVEGENDDTWEARALGVSAATYVIDWLGGASFLLMDLEWKSHPADSLAAAKAMAQADYERRVLSALDPAPACAAPAGTPMVACPNRDPLLRTAADQERG